MSIRLFAEHRLLERQGALVVEWPSREWKLPGPPGVVGPLLVLRWSLTRCRSAEKRALARRTAASVGRNRVCDTDCLVRRSCIKIMKHLRTVQVETG